jgi:chromatin remodeling complex protein RSC6
MSSRKINTVEERRQFVQEIIDRLLYLNAEEREKFISSIQSTVRRFKPKMNVINDGATRIYKPL